MKNNTINFNVLTALIETKITDDYMGRRVEYISSENDVVNQHAKFVYNGYVLIQELSNANILLKEFVWDPTAGQATTPLVFKLVENNETFFYTQDANKNIAELVFADTAKGVATHYEYDSFGNTIVTTNSSLSISNTSAENIASLNPFKFSSEYHDSALGLVYYNYRHYNPNDGRWLSRDPIAEKGGYNLYGMVRNNVNNRIDLLGLVPIFNGTIEGSDEIEELETTIWKEAAPVQTVSIAYTVSNAKQSQVSTGYEATVSLLGNYGTLGVGSTFTMNGSLSYINSLTNSGSLSWSYFYGVDGEYKEVLRHKTSMNKFLLTSYFVTQEETCEKYGYVYIGKNELPRGWSVGCVTQDICADLKSLKRTGVIVRTTGAPTGNYRLTGSAYGSSNNLQALLKDGNRQLKETFNNVFGLK